MPGKTRHLSKTDLRRGHFTKAGSPPAPDRATRTARPDATSVDEQALLFDLAPIDAALTTHPAKSGKPGE